MKSNYPAVALLAACLAAAGCAEAQPGPYVAFLSGPNFLLDGDDHYTATGVVLTNSYNAGSGISAIMGYRFASAGAWLDGLRIEEELSYRSNDLNHMTVANDGGAGAAAGIGSLNGSTAAATGDMSTTAFMTNVFFDIPTGTLVHPYIGVGIGAELLAANHVAIGGIDLIDDAAMSLAVQAGAGAAFELTSKTALLFDVRFLTAVSPSLADTAGSQVDSAYRSVNLRIGVRRDF